jgi:hypothetical protein
MVINGIKEILTTTPAVKISSIGLSQPAVVLKHIHGATTIFFFKKSTWGSNPKFGFCWNFLGLFDKTMLHVSNGREIQIFIMYIVSWYVLGTTCEFIGPMSYI